MRLSKQWLGIAVVGITLGSACSSPDEKPKVEPEQTAGMSSSGAAGAAGSKPNGDEAGAGAGGTAGAPDSDNLAGAGAGGGDACVGDYECPDVLYASHAVIKVELPVSVADAADALFTACRNAECYSALGSAKVDAQAVNSKGQEDGWVNTVMGGTVFLNFDESGAKPFAVIDWAFYLDQPIAGDHYSLKIQPAGAADPTTLLDAEVTYTTTVADPELVSEGFCRHCSEVSIGTLEVRAAD